MDEPRAVGRLRQFIVSNLSAADRADVIMWVMAQSGEAALHAVLRSAKAIEELGEGELEPEDAALQFARSVASAVAFTIPGCEPWRHPEIADALELSAEVRQVLRGIDLRESRGEYDVAEE